MDACMLGYATFEKQGAGFCDSKPLLGMLFLRNGREYVSKKNREKLLFSVS